jgi:hypothetical protein
MQEDSKYIKNKENIIFYGITKRIKLSKYKYRINYPNSSK